MLAKQLRQKYNLKQKEIGNLLGVTQAAVSQYMRKVRGIALDLDNNKEICKLVEEIATNLYVKKLSTPELVYLLCNICEVVRRKGMMCKLHKRIETSFVTKDCEICFM
jgi:predicted transcriptional regulator